MRLDAKKVAKKIWRIGNGVLNHAVRYMNISELVECRKSAEALLAVVKAREIEARNAILGKEDTVNE